MNSTITSKNCIEGESIYSLEFFQLYFKREELCSYNRMRQGGTRHKNWKNGMGWDSKTILRDGTASLPSRGALGFVGL
jgi:hypothetical protein